jgi:UPF0755 protein
VGKLFGVLLLLLAVGVVGGWFYVQHVYTEEGPATADGTPRVVLVPKGAGVAQVSKTLFETGAIKDELHFRTAVRLQDLLPGPEGDLDLKAGEYAVPSGASMKQVVEMLSTGTPLQYAVVIPEHLTSAQIIKLLTAKEWDAATKAPRTYTLAGDAPPTPAEGVMLPGDYAVQRGDTIESVVNRAIKRQQDLLTKLWPNRQDGLPLKTPQEAVILASVVEKETGNANERPGVAAVFVNRLRRSMRLESDPTIIYGINKGEPLGRAILASEKARKTDWNTYQMGGLPKTPICNPGEASIKAVLNPPVSKALFFVADGTGAHAFAETYAEHQKNVAIYRKVRAANEAAGVNTPSVRPRK